MKNQFSYLFLAFTIFSLNALPAQAAKKTTQDNTKKQLASTSTEWCFELPQMGLFCFEL